MSRARGMSKGSRWLVAGAIFASACSAPYEPETQFWPGDGQLTGAGTGSVQTGGTNATGGSASVETGGSGFGFGGAAGSVTGGTFGGTSSLTGGASAGGSGGAGGAGNSGAGSVFGGGSGFGGFATGGGGSGGGMASGGSGGSGSGGTTSTGNCSLTVKVTTAAAGGRYAPRNIGAVWIADQSGNFVRSLEVWAQRRASNLTLWNSATSKAGAPGSRVDIVSQATLSNHVAHTSTWNCQDFNKKPVPDGSYRVYFEMTDQSSAGPNRFEVFTKGPAAATLKPTDNNNFKAIELSFKP